MCRQFVAASSTMTKFGVFTVLLLVIITTSSADPNKNEHVAGRSAGYSRSQKSLQPESDIPVSLPNSYSDLGPNVRASKSYRRPSRRIGMAAEGEETQLNPQYANHRVPKHAQHGDDTQDVTSQPDISSVISNDSKNRLAERISAMKKRFPNMRNRFGSRLKPGRPNDDEKLTGTDEEEGPVQTHEQSSGPVSRDSSELTNTNLVIPTTEHTPAERKRPFVVRRPSRNQLRIGASEPRGEEQGPQPTEARDESRLNKRPSMGNRFRQILNKRRENEHNGDDGVDFEASRVNSPQRYQPSAARSDPSNTLSAPEHGGNDLPRNIRNNRGREGARRRPEQDSKNPPRSFNNLKTTSFSTNSFGFPIRTQEEASNEVNLHVQNQDTAYPNNENRDPERKFPRRNPPHEQVPDKELPNYQEENQPPPRDVNRHPSHREHQDKAPLNPSVSDNGRNWYPNDLNEPNDNPSSNQGYRQFEQHEEQRHVQEQQRRVEEEQRRVQEEQRRDPEEQRHTEEEKGILLPREDGIYRDDLRRFTASPREENERARHPYYSRNRSPGRPASLDAPERRERLGVNRDNTQNHYNIPDLTLTTHETRPNTPEPFSQRTHATSSPSTRVPVERGQRPKLYRNTNVMQNQISTGYQQYNHQSSTPKQNESPEWAFDPKWAVSDGSFVTDRTPFTSSPVVSTTERFLMEPTRVPGSPHLIARNEFPYNFWRPANANRANEGIYPKSRQSEFSDLEPEFRQVPDYLFTVGAGPVSVPEDLVRNTYEMVTASPSFDLMNNPFEPENSQFKTMPDIEELESVNSLRNPQRRPQRPNRNRRPHQRNNSGRNNPFSSIRNMLSPGPASRNPRTRPSMRPKRPEGNIHPDRPNFGGNGEGSHFRLTLNPTIPNNVPKQFRPHPSVLPSGRSGSRQPTSLATTLVPTHTSSTPGAVGFTHFGGTPQSHGSPSDELSKNSHQRHENKLNSEKDQYSRDEQWKLPNQESIIGEKENLPAQAHFQQPMRSLQGERFNAPPGRFNNFRRAHNGRPRFPERPHNARSSPHRNHPGNGHKFKVQEPNWVRDISQDLAMFDKSVIKPVNPHSRYTTTHGPALPTRSHFDVKQIDVERPQRPNSPHDVRSHGPKIPHAIRPHGVKIPHGVRPHGPKNVHSERPRGPKLPHAPNLGHREGPAEHFPQEFQFQFGADPADEQDRQHHDHPNHFKPQQNIEHYRVRIPRPRPVQALTLSPRPNRPQQNHVRQEPQQQSIWSALTNFDFSFLNPFSGYNNQDSDYTNDVDRVATAAAAIPASVLVPGGLAVLGAGLSLFYFNFVWSPTPVVKARLIDMIMKGTHASVLTEEQQRAIGDVTKVYSALSDMSTKLSGPEQEAMSAEQKESLMSQDCKNKLVCQTYHEFTDLLEVTKGAATLLGGALKRLDQDLLLEYFLAADRGHHLPSEDTCASYYPSCELPELSIKGALREIAGLPIPGNSLDGGSPMEEGRSFQEGLRKRNSGNSVRRVGLPTTEPSESEDTTEGTSEVWTTIAGGGGTTPIESVPSSSTEEASTTQGFENTKKSL